MPLVHRVCPDRREVEQENKLQPGDIAAHRIRVYAAKFEQPHAPLHRGTQPHEHEELILAAAANDIEVRQQGIPSRTSDIRRSLTAVAGAAGMPCKDEFHLLSKLRSEHPKVMSFKKTNAKRRCARTPRTAASGSAGTFPAFSFQAGVPTDGALFAIFALTRPC